MQIVHQQRLRASNLEHHKRPTPRLGQLAAADHPAGRRGDGATGIRSGRPTHIHQQREVTTHLLKWVAVSLTPHFRISASTAAEAAEFGGLATLHDVIKSWCV
jgi:hypothetical protein